MLHHPQRIPPCAAFWDEAARTLIKSELLGLPAGEARCDFSAIRVVVPTFLHAQLLREAMAARLACTFIAPRIVTLDAWLALQAPVTAATESERIVSLYAELRRHGWLKKLFDARRNTDLLPLARTIAGLCDELTHALLPAQRLSPGEIEQRWQAALSQLSPSAQHVLSSEAQLVWSIWKAQLEADDRHAARYSQMLSIADSAHEPLVWISPVEPSPCEAAFLEVYARRQPVLPIVLDWRAHLLNAACVDAWPEMAEVAEATERPRDIVPPAGVLLCAANNLEQEAQLGAQTVIDWLRDGKSAIAIIAQDRVAARRVRALLERARIRVADETGWKLSTTRAASMLAAWLDTITTRAETAVLLDLLKSPYLAAGMPEQGNSVMKIEFALRAANVDGGWEAILGTLDAASSEHRWLKKIAQAAQAFDTRRRTIAQWVAATLEALIAIDACDALAADAAGEQLLAMLHAMRDDCNSLKESMSFAEWRAFVGMQLESTPYRTPQSDKRVAMLPLNGARLRSFDAVLVLGADAANLPSRSSETLFFANAVRRELGLATREALQRQQLRDFTEVLHANREVVLSWQAFRDGEINPVSPWISRLQLALQRAQAEKLAVHTVCIERHEFRMQPVNPPQPRAPQLLPGKISASAYNSLAACPYQFFAQRMLRVSALDELSDMPEKRDYGMWLHEILNTYHEALLDHPLAPEARMEKLREISEKRFEPELARSAAALGYYVRWQKAMPAYLDWCEEREQQGWRYAAGEHNIEKVLPFPGGEITLHGRIDRVDENAAGELAVLDYKTRPLSSLRARLKKAEDHQLAFYGLLFDTPLSDACYVALEPENEKTGAAGPANYEQWRQALNDQVVGNLAAISQGAPLPASGVNEVCSYCEVRGLCRKGVW